MAEVHRIVRPPYFPYPQTRLTAPNSYKDTVKDYNFGSLIRTNAHGEYTETNTIFSESLSRLHAVPRRVRAVQLQITVSMDTPHAQCSAVQPYANTITGRRILTFHGASLKLPGPVGGSQQHV